MALFNKKKKEELSLPDFPDLPNESLPSFPAYRPKEFSSLKEIKQAVKPTLPELKEFPKLEQMPKLTETMSYEPKQIQERFPTLPKEQDFDIPVRKPMPRIEQQPLPRIIEQPMSRPTEAPRQYIQETYTPQAQQAPRYEPKVEAKPLYVQIEEYSKIMDTINTLKFSIQEAERTITNMKMLKEKQNEEIARWEDQLNKVKERLLTIDKKLFQM